MSPNVQTVRTAAGAIMKGDVVTWQAAMDPEIIFHIPGTSPLSGTYRGLEEGMRGFFGRVAVLTDGTFTIDAMHDIVGGDDHVIGLYEMSATRDGVGYRYRQMNCYHVQDGLIREVFLNQFESDIFEAMLA